MAANETFCFGCGTPPPPRVEHLTWTSAKRNSASGPTRSKKTHARMSSQELKVYGRVKPLSSGFKSDEVEVTEEEGGKARLRARNALFMLDGRLPSF